MTKSHTPTLSGLSLLIFIRPPENRVFLNPALGLCTELVPNACVSRQTNTTARTLLPVPANCPATTSTQTGLCSSPKRPRRSTATLLLQKPLRKRMPVGTGNSRASEWGASPCFAAATKYVDAVNSK